MWVLGSGELREKRSGVQASLLGVGAPEALVIGVVALLVFGPKGLAEVSSLLCTNCSLSSKKLSIPC